MNTQNDIYAEGLNIQKEISIMSKFYISPSHTAEQIAKLLFLHKYARINNKGIKRIEKALDRFAKNNKEVALELAKQLAAHPDGKNLKTLADSFSINVSDLPEEKEEVPVEDMEKALMDINFLIDNMDYDSIKFYYERLCTKKSTEAPLEEAIEAIKVSAKEEEITIEQWYDTTCEKLDPNKRIVSDYCNNNEVKPADLFEVTKESIEEAIAETSKHWEGTDSSTFVDKIRGTEPEPENKENISLAEMLEEIKKPSKLKKRFLTKNCTVVYEKEFKEYARANQGKAEFNIHYDSWSVWFEAVLTT